ncbi:hypothetical protein VHEMI06649 [[Torrubiella] hemipterigena]|uniref:Uncharacterized protein n=1 Tax=[Torrubiella] hemipterigena TaxID=1531966 RepID=A0A0A1TLG7_9HYPO|nr:hypothetical protein VHEMI06649 [[Torrubiella] hemipterigena]
MNFPQQGQQQDDLLGMFWAIRPTHNAMSSRPNNKKNTTNPQSLAPPANHAGSDHCFDLLAKELSVVPDREVPPTSTEVTQDTKSNTPMGASTAAG